MRQLAYSFVVLVDYISPTKIKRNKVALQKNGVEDYLRFFQTERNNSPPNTDIEIMKIVFSFIK